MTFAAGPAGAGDVEDKGGIFAPGAKLTQIFGDKQEGFILEGPAMAPDGSLYFSDITFTHIKGMKGGNIWKLDPKTNEAVIFRSPSGMANGIAFDAEGRMVVAEGADFGGRGVTRYDLETGQSEYLAKLYGGHPFNAPNDIVVDRGGHIFFTDPRYFGYEAIEQPVTGVYRIDPDGSVHLAILNVREPNGIAISPDGRTLYVVSLDFGPTNQVLRVHDDYKGDPHPVSSAIHAFDLAEDGSVKYRGVAVSFGPDDGVADGIKLDSKGNFYVGSGGPWLNVFSPEGKKIARAKMPVDGFTVNVGFGKGAFDHTLFVATSAGMFTIETANTGAM